MKCTYLQSRYFPFLEQSVFSLISKSYLCRGITTNKCFKTSLSHQKRYIKTSSTKLQQPLISPHNEDRTKRYYLITGAAVFCGVAYFGTRYYLSAPQVPKKLKEEIKEDKSVVKIPSDPKDIPKKIPYLLIGGGTASFSAFRAIKAADPTAKVLVVANELYYPYMRPPLSKELWLQNDDQALRKLSFRQWNGTQRSVFFEPEEYFIQSNLIENEPKGGIAVIRGWSVKKVDAEKKTAILDDGTEISYDKCLLATGIHPKTLPIFEKANDIKDKVTLFRAIDDFKKLYEAINNGAKSILIVGGSFLGSELACALSRNNTSGLKVTQIFPEKGNLSKILPEYLSRWTTDRMREQGIEVIPNVDVVNVSSSINGKQIQVTLSNGEKKNVDYVIVAVGSESNTDLAETSGLEVDPELGGFLVNSELAARTDLYAAGDCSCFYDPQLGRRRVEHHDHAVTSGRLAGENMAGAHKAYSHQSMFWSDLGPEIGFEGVGIIDSALPTVAIYAKTQEENSQDQEAEKESKETTSETNINISLPKQGEDYNRGIVFYLKDNLIVGILMWNVFSKVTLARQVLKERKKFDDLNEVAKLFNIHADV